MHTVVVNQRLRRYAADTMITKRDVDIRNLKQALLTQCYFSEKLWNLAFWCGGVYIK